MRIRSALLAATCAVAMLGGCATPLGEDGPPPVPTLSELPTATPTLPPLPPIPEPQPGTIVIGGQALTIYPKDGSAPQTLAYSVPNDAIIASLTGLFGAAPVLTAVAGDGNCSPSFTRRAWGDFQVRTDFGGFADPTYVEVYSETSSEAGVTILSSLGIGPDDVSAGVFAATPANLKLEGEYDGEDYFFIYFDFIGLSTPDADVTLSNDDGTFPSGGYMYGTDGVVERVVAPAEPAYGAGC